MEWRMLIFLFEPLNFREPVTNGTKEIHAFGK